MERKWIVANGPADRTLRTIGRHNRTPKEKVRIVRRYLDGVAGKKTLVGIKKLSDLIGSSPKTLRTWIRAYKKGGPEALGALPAKAPRYDPLDTRTWRSHQPFSPRDIATIRYGMPGLTNSQVGAYFGRDAATIREIRKGIKGGPIAAPVPTPKWRTEQEANQWFVHKAVKVLEAWMKMLEEIESKGDDANIEETLKEADHEVGARSARIAKGQRVKRRPADHPVASVAAEPGGRREHAAGVSGELRASAPADQGQPPQPAGPPGAGGQATGADQATGGYIVRRRGRGWR